MSCRRNLKKEKRARNEQMARQYRKVSASISAYPASLIPISGFPNFPLKRLQLSLNRRFIFVFDLFSLHKTADRQVRRSRRLPGCQDRIDQRRQRVAQPDLWPAYYLPPRPGVVFALAHLAVRA
jgi:hypothetical protein